MAAIIPIHDNDNERRMINQFTQGLHDKIVRSDVKRYVLSHSEEQGFASWHVLDAAKYQAKDHGVEEAYFKSYSESAALLSKRPDSGKFSVSNVNTKEQERQNDKTEDKPDPKAPEFIKQDAGTTRSRTPDTSRDTNRNQVTQPNRLTQVTCYNCQQKGHVSRYCRNKKVSTPRVEDKPYNADKPKYNTSSTQQKDQNVQTSQKQLYEKSTVRQTRFSDDQRQDYDSQDEQDAIVGNNVNVRINATIGEIKESGEISRAKVFDADYKEIAVVVKVNDAKATAIIVYSIGWVTNTRTISKK